MVKQFRIDPWTCVAPLAIVELMKMESMRENACDYQDLTTIHGYQPTIADPLSMEPMVPLYNEISKVLDETLDHPWEIYRSWFVSYDRGGYQVEHRHDLDGEAADYSLVVSLMDSSNNGLLALENGMILDMVQGDGVIFPGGMVHSAGVCTKPKTIIAMDIRKKMKKS
jgi:hypothetical protein